MIAGVSADIRPLIGETVRRGGHVRVGLEDAPLGTKAGNLDWSKRPCGWCASMAPNRLRPVKCGKHWRHPPDNRVPPGRS